MNIAQIRNIDVANGEGVRVSLFVSGCKFNCFNCFNKEYQNFNYGEKFTDKHIDKLIELLKPRYIKGLSILGGEPMEHPIELHYLLSTIRKFLREDQDIWMWSGYTLGQILLDPDKIKVLRELDILVDGLYVEEKRDLNLRFSGSSNQRIIDVKKTLENEDIILWDPNY